MSMVSALTFKGDKKPKKRKRVDASEKFTATDVAAVDGPQAEGGDIADDSWVAAEGAQDLVGPIMIVLPTEPPTCVACDTHGKVFTSEIENILDANPATAEPHDVRQVWIVNKIVGADTCTLKGHHGRYLSCDRHGILSANTEAVSPLETFRTIPTADVPGTFQIQTLRDTFLTARGSTAAKAGATPEVRGDAEEISFNTTVRIRMQARFKPRLKASKEEKAKGRISRKELEEQAGRKLEEDEVRMLKKARREGDYHEALLLIKVKTKHDRFS